MISIVIPYYNRRTLLLNTLRSILYFIYNGVDIETIIIDDGSTKSESINDVPDLFKKLNIKLIVLRKGCVGWRSPSTAYNYGFNIAQGETVLLNSSDCFHVGSILEYVAGNITDKRYLNFSTFHGSDSLNNVFNRLDWNSTKLLPSINSALGDFSDGWWRCHSVINRTFIPFCAAISRTNLETLNGYDELFTDGIGYDDYDFTDRITNLGLEMILADEPFCVHQAHPLIEYKGTRNRDLLSLLNRTEPNRIKATNNLIYVR